MADTIRFGIVGLGNIGGGVAEVFTENRDVINARLPKPLELVRVADLDTTKLVPSGTELTDKVDKVLKADDIDIVIELIGGIDPARRFVEAALKAGKHVVTANKTLIADCGPELFSLAAKNGVSLLFEAAVGGGIPCIRALQQGVASNEIISVRGIVNGTCNYILTRMSQEGSKYQDVLADAQKLGFAEPDPTADVEGHDAAQKVAILASLAFGMDVRFSNVFVEGISQITQADLALAAETGHVIKLIGTAKRSAPGEPAEVRAHPVMLPKTAPLAQINGVTNAVEINGNAVGQVVLIGPGAGARPTAAAILTDVMNLAQQMVDGGASLDRRLKIPLGKNNLKSINDVVVGHCLRLTLNDKPEIEEKVKEILTANGIGIKDLIDRGRRVGEYFSIAVFTEPASEAALQQALNAIDTADITLEPPTVLRVEE